MIHKPIALVLGGTNPHIYLIENLKARGFFTVLIDYYDNPPAKYVADQHIKESTLDKEKVLAISISMKVSLVISLCIDQANTTACYVAEKLELPKPYSYETALNVTNKGLMKHLMIENNIPTSKHIYIQSVSEFFDSGLNFPVVVKPADSNGSVGVRKANSEIEFLKYVEEAKEISRTGKVIIEEFVEGIEISIDCFVKDKKTEIILIRQKLELLKEKENVLQSTGSFSPGNISELALARIQKVVNSLPLIFNFDNTPLLVQAFLDGDNISIIEFAPRISGGLSLRTIQLNTGFDILDSAIDHYLGINSKIEFTKANSYVATIIIYAIPGIFDRITGYQKLIEDNIIENFYPYKTKGMQIGGDMSTRSRIGAFIVKSANKKELNQKIQSAIDTLEVFDNHGKKIMRKDIYKKLDSDNSIIP